MPKKPRPKSDVQRKARQREKYRKEGRIGIEVTPHRDDAPKVREFVRGLLALRGLT